MEKIAGDCMYVERLIKYSHIPFHTLIAMHPLLQQHKPTCSNAFWGMENVAEIQMIGHLCLCVGGRGGGVVCAHRKSQCTRKLQSERLNVALGRVSICVRGTFGWTGGCPWVDGSRRA